MSKLRERREAAHLTQFELAHRAGVSLSQYVDIESGKANPRLKTAQAIASSLNATVDAIWPTITAPAS